MKYILTTCLLVNYTIKIQVCANFSTESYANNQRKSIVAYVSSLNCFCK